jgi:diguanylate cyclase (GGDEF)-like protein/PAS domain S-box-containing protein
VIPEARALLDALPYGIQVLEAGEDGLVLVWANAEACRQAGFDLAAHAGKPLREAFPAGPEWHRQILDACASQQPREIELPYGDGRVGNGWWRARVRPLGDRRVLAAYENVTDGRERDRALLASERLNRIVVESLREGVLVVDGKACILQCNAAAAELAGVDPQGVIGRRLIELPIEVQDAEGKPLAFEAFPQRRALLGDTVRGELLRVVRADGQTRWLEVDSTPLRSPEEGAPTGAVSTYRDVTVGIERERRIREEADTDPLTGLGNRRALERVLGAAIQRAAGRARRVAVVAMDLDGFKEVNDRWGHPAGDGVLREVAARLRGCVRERDLVARMGGDEFVLVLTDVEGDSGAPEDCRRRIRDALARPLTVDGSSVSLSAATGVAGFPQDGADATALLEHADRAMYERKAAEGRR